MLEAQYLSIWNLLQNFNNTNRIESQMNAAPHMPVMLKEVLDSLNPEAGKLYLDGTFGAGGYTRAILGAADCKLVAIDRDETALAAAQEVGAEYSSRFEFLQGCFGDAQALLRSAGYDRVDGFVLDVGVSSMQIDQAERGFSFRHDGPLDMRMGRAAGGVSAADLVNTLAQDDLANIIYKYGEERHSRRVARAIVMRRAERPFETTLDLAQVVRSALPFSRGDKIDPATRSFQALRIAVNDELGELERALAAAEHILRPGGRLVVVTFHSLEDRIVKNFMKEKCGARERVSRYAPVVEVNDGAQVAPFEAITRKALKAGAEEARINPRARSAKLRAAKLRVHAGGGGVA